MPIHPSSRPASARPADTLWQPKRPRIGPPTHDDRMPMTIHVHVYEEGPTDPVQRKDHAGSFRFAPSFVKWLDSGPLPKAIREQRLPPRLWWQSAYLVGRLEAHFGRDGVRAVVHAHHLRAAFARWERDEWDELDDDVYEAHEAALGRALRQHAATCCGGGHDVDWLDRLAQRFQRHVWHTYYPSNRDRKEQQQGRSA